MTRDLSEVSALLLAFRDGSVSPEQFAERYAPLWRELIREQDEAIAAHPTVGSSLPRLREMESRGEISTDEYQEQVQRLYASLSGVRLRTGTDAAKALDQVYVIADAWEATQDSDEPLVSLEELHEGVNRALSALESAPTST